MGHSTVSFSKQGLLSHSQIKDACREKRSDHREEYGYSESPSSFASAGDPSTSHLYKIYSQSAASDVIDKIGNYDCIALYFVPDNLWNKHFNSTKKAEAKLQKDLTKTRLALKTLIDNTVKNSSTLQSPDKSKPIFVTCSLCNSKINATMYLKRTNNTPSQCPICGDNHKGTFMSFWRSKLFGKSYVSKRTKLETKISDLEKKIEELKGQVPKFISVSDLDKYKDFKKAVKTVVAADVHH